jgi:tetratricopeptide (TPR) repeat protein
MTSSRWSVVAVVVFFSLLSHAQLEKIVIPAGTPEDQALQAISNETDAQKKLPMYEDFLTKFAANPAAVAYGNWQVSQYYETAGDLPKAMEYGDKALAGAPHNLDILVSQVNIAQRAKDGAKIIAYATQGGGVYNSLTSDADKAAGQNSYDFLEAAAYNAIVAETNAKARMGYVERFTPAFPNSRFADGVTSYAMMALSDLKDMARLVAYGEKTLASNPTHLPTLLLLANTYVEDPKPGSLAKGITYARKAIEVAKASAADADTAHKISAGVAHSTLGYAYMKQEKTTLALPELKAATGLLKGQDDQQYAIAAYRLGFAYGKLNRMAEAREILLDAAKVSGPMQPSIQELLAKVNGARAKAR